MTQDGYEVREYPGGTEYTVTFRSGITIEKLREYLASVPDGCAIKWFDDDVHLEGIGEIVFEKREIIV